jgi:flagellar hook-length control protein FliK
MPAPALLDLRPTPVAPAQVPARDVPEGTPRATATGQEPTLRDQPDVSAHATLPGERATSAADAVRGKASSPVGEQLRTASQAVRRTTATEAPQPTAAAAIAVRTFATDVQDVPPATTPVQSAVVAAIDAAAAGVARGRQSAASDSGDPQHFLSHAQGASRQATPVATTPAPAPAFSTLLNSSQGSDGLPTQTSTQIVQAIRLQVLREAGEAHIKLDPRQFGDMTVRIRVEQGQVTARVEADTPVVREWLQSNQHVLRQSLAGQHLAHDRLDVHEPPASSGHGRRDDGSERERSPDEQRQRRRRPETGDRFEVVA